MDKYTISPRIFRIAEGQAQEVQQTPYGSVGTLFSREGVEMVWVCKQHEAIDPAWFSQEMVDLLVVLQGQLKMEFAHPDFQSCILQPGDIVILPPQTPCRAYRWPREAEQATIFLAIYPQHTVQSHHPRATPSASL